MDGLEGCHVLSLACGYGTTLFVVRDETDDDHTTVNKIPTLDPSVPKALTDRGNIEPEKGGISKSKGGKKAKK